MIKRTTIMLLLAVAGLMVADQTAQAAQPEFTWIYVSDMHCGACAKKIARKLYALPGVMKVQTHLEKDFVVITPQAGKTLSPRQLWDAIEVVEFTPVKLIGPAGTFEEKPTL